MARADVLRSVYQTLERSDALVTTLGHVKDATSIKAGARIIGDSVRIDSLPLPIVILGFEGGDALAAAREMKEWTLEALIYSEDVFQAAELLDLIEDACLSATLNTSDTQPLNRLQAGPHQRLEPDTPNGRVIATRMVITAKWIS